MSPSEVINEVLRFLNINAKALSETLGYERPQIIYDIKNGKTRTISQSLANKISSVYSDINTSWLLTGEGEMLKSGSEKKPVDPDCEGLLATIKELSETVNRQSKEIERLNIELDKYKKASIARGEDAGCAAVGATG